MYVGIAPPRSGARVYDPGGLVDIEQRRAEEEQRGEHEQRQERGDTESLVADATQQEEQDETGEERRDHERRERAEGVDEVRAGELHTASQRGPESAPLD